MMLRQHTSWGNATRRMPSRVHVLQTRQQHKLAQQHQDAPVMKVVSPISKATLRNLVVAVDHTEASYKAVKWTLEHLYREGDVLHLLHVVPASSSLVPQPFGLATTLPPEEGLQETMASHARQYFETYLHMAKKYGAACELDLVHGACNQTVSRTICKKVEDLSAAVVVLSEHKRGFFEGMFQSPVSKQVAENCSRPTLVLNHKL